MAINILDKHTANLIAAGEVVERPASAIKEMLENSADAGATRITVEIQNGGTSYFRVTDNGCGISAEDLPKAVLRHATSKICSSADLYAIGTYGFRGEALAAIAAVCDLRILTKRREDTFGSVLHINGGEIIENGEAGCPDGTTIAASDIFKNVPARRKFLKKDVTEASACLAVTEKFALSRPDISVTFISDGNIKLKTSGDGILKNTVYSCLGKEFASKLIKLDYSYEAINISGYIGKPETARPSRSMQNFFVNGRYVRSGTICAALEEGFRAFCPVGKFPAAVIFCNLDFSRVDVNIHPAKTEVKFSEEKKVFEAVLFAVKTALNSGASYQAPSYNVTESPKTNSATVGTQTQITSKDIAKAIGIGQVPKESTVRPLHNDIQPDEKTEVIQKPQIPVSQNSTAQKSPEITQPEPKQSFPDVPFGDMKAVQEQANRFIEHTKKTAVPDFKNAFMQDTEGVAGFGPKIDPDKPIVVCSPTPEEYMEIFAPPKKEQTHETVTSAKHEQPEQISFELPEETQAKIKFRIIGQCFDSFILVEKDNILYIIDKHAAHERILYEEIKNSVSVSSQVLLEPERISLTTDECAALIENKEYFDKTGFDFDSIGNGSIVVRSYPEHINKEDLSDVFTAMAAKLMEGNDRAAGNLFDRALFSAACKAAVKAGQRSSVFHDEYIADKIFSSEAILYCPHGRPVITELSKEKLYKMFKRT